MPETTPYHFELAFGPSTAKQQQLEKIAQHSTMMKMLSRVVILPRPSFKPLTESCGKLALGDIIIKNFCVRISKFEIPHDYHIFSGSLTVQTKCLSGKQSTIIQKSKDVSNSTMKLVKLTFQCCKTFLKPPSNMAKIQFCEGT